MANLEFIGSGSIGRFVRWDGASIPDDEPPEYGWIVGVGEAAHIDVIDERDPFDHSENGGRGSTTRALIGQLPDEVVVLLELRSRGGVRNFGGHRASTQRYSARTVIGGSVPLYGLRSSKLIAMRTLYRDLNWWAGMSSSEEKFEIEDGIIRGFELKMSSPPTVSARIDARFELRIEPKWSVGGDEDHRILSDPIAIGCASTRPTEAYEFFRVLFEVQGLLSALFRGHTTADAGEAELDLDPLVPRHDRGSYPMWQGELMVTPDGVSRRADAHPPILNLADIGGVAGLARWVRLCRKHPRATEVALSPYRSGYSRAEVEILSLGSSFEYWVASHRDRQWAAKPNRGKGKGGTPDIALAMAGRAGDPFRKWVGQSDQWCRQFWSAYNGLKHDPRFAVDPYELSDLVMSARYLLTAVLLDRTANNRVPSSTMFASHLLAELGLRLRKRLE